jgi:hypothetical protein
MTVVCKAAALPQWQQGKKACAISAMVAHAFDPVNESLYEDV